MNKIYLVVVVLLSVALSGLALAAEGAPVSGGVGVVQGLLDRVPDLVKALGLLISAASIIAAMTPNKTDDSVVSWLARFVNFFAVNVGHAKSVEVPGDEVIKSNSGGR